MALSPIFCAKCSTGFAVVLKLEACPACNQPTTWLDHSPVPLVPFKLTRQDANWMRHARIGVDVGDLAVTE